MRELLARVDSRELSEWMAFYDIDPWGEQRADHRNARLAATLATLHTGKAWRVEEFMLHPVAPEQGEETEPTDPEAERRRIILLNAQMGGETHGPDDQ